MSISEIPTIKADVPSSVADYSLHGLITIRLVDAPPSAMAELEYYLGPSQGLTAAEPDIRITYTAGLRPRDRLRHVGLHEAAYDDEGFYLVNEQERLVQFDFGRLGEPCEFLCEAGADVLPYLLPVVGLRLLRKGYVMLHAASLVYEGRGILVAGWQKGGKTETLLAFMAAGAHYLADEWTILSPSAGKMWGVPGTLKMWEWHLRYLPEYWERLRPDERRRLRLHRLYQRVYQLLPGQWKRRGFVGKRLERLSLDGGSPVLGLVQATPERVFGDHVWRGATAVDLVLLAGVGSAVSVSPIESSAVARRMVASLAYERQALLPRYEQFRFAFPERRNEFLEAADELELQYLEQVFRNKPAYELLHPYPVPLPALYRACLPLVRQVGQGSFLELRD